jgi:hypothetical protein
MHTIKDAIIVEYMGRIYASFDDPQEEYQSNMIEVEGKIINHSIILTES